VNDATTLYVAGPMTGLPEFNYPAFRDAENRLTASGYRVLNPIDSEAFNDTGAPQAWDWYMRHAIRMVLAADGIALLDGWENSRGARLEHRIATDLGLPIRALHEWADA